MKINLGSGTDIRPGYVNADGAYLPGVDVILDLSVAPLPFADQCVDEALCIHVIEHVVPLVPLLREIHRVLKWGAGRCFTFLTSLHLQCLKTHTSKFFCLLDISVFHQGWSSTLLLRFLLLATGAPHAEFSSTPPFSCSTGQLREPTRATGFELFTRALGCGCYSEPVRSRRCWLSDPCIG
ncbi:MAG: methyltransferase domain-containing protein [Deltaproteobacteria bacterium]|nr:methyltransferase domain-containing protein [Deltaproteobacteria bacterium]